MMTQAQLDKALKSAQPTDIIVCRGSGRFTAYDSSQVTACDSSQVTACDSSQVTASGSSQVTAYDSSQVTAYDSSQVRAHDSAQVTAYHSAQVRAHDSAQVTAHDSAQVRAYQSAQVRAHDSAQVTASGYVAVTTHPGRYGTPKITGGVVITIPEITTAAEWLEFHGVEVKHGIATLYKAVGDDYSTGYARRAKITYAPGSKPEAPDWNSRPECGGGLHLSPRPIMALAYNPSATKYVACPVKVSDIVLIDDKCKVPRVARPTFEVDIDGDPIKEAA